MEDQDRIIKRIRRLLNMAGDSSSPEEAAIAARRAQALMAKHQLDRADVVIEELEDDPESVTARVGDLGYIRPPGWFQTLGISIARATETRTWFGKRDGTRRWRSVYAGYRPDVELAHFLEAFLVSQVEQLAKAHRETESADPSLSFWRSPRRHMASYRSGLVAGICAKLSEFYAEGDPAVADTARALVTAKQNAIDERFGPLTYNKARPQAVERDAYTAGREDSRRVNVARGLESGPAEPHAGPALIGHDPDPGK